MTDITRLDDKQDDKQIAFGGTLKSTLIDENTARIGGYLIYFTDAAEKDLYDEYFNAKTDYCIKSVEEMNGLPVYYQHGLDSTLDVKQLSTLENVHMDEVGIWADAQLDLHDEYQRAIHERLAKKGVLGWSSGAWPQSYKSASDGWIERWKVIEGSLTPTPAMPKRTVISARSYVSLLKDGNGHEKQEQGLKADTQNIPLNELSPEVIKMNEEMLALLKQILAAVTADAQMDQSEQDTAMAAMAAAPMTEEDTTVATDPNADQVKKAVVLQRLINAAVKSVNDRRAAQQNAIALALNGVKGAMSQAMPASRTAHVGAVTPQQTSSKGFVGGLGVSESLKFSHMSASDMAFTTLLMGSDLSEKAFKRAQMEDVGLSEDFINHMKHKVTDHVNTRGMGDSRDTIAVKSALPWRANEIDSTTNTGYGLEWASTFWGSEVWLKARAQPVYKNMIAKGMQEYEVPQGATSLKVPTEAADPTVYAVQQNNDVGSDNRPPVLATPTPFGTGNVSLNPGLLLAISYYTNQLEEDSIVPIAAQLNYQMQKKMAETIEQAIINGDTATGANTNINLIDGTPGTGTSRPYYLNNNGLFKYPLVTNTALSRAASGFNLQDFRSTLNLYGPEFGTNKQNMFWLMDYYTEVTVLGFPEFATEDVAGRYATIDNGQVLKVYNIDNIVSGFIVKANSSGKVPAAGGALGRMALVYAPYWALGYKRDVRLETGYYVEAQAKSLVASTRFDIVARGASASAITYNITLS